MPSREKLHGVPFFRHTSSQNVYSPSSVSHAYSVAENNSHSFKWYQNSSKLWNFVVIGKEMRHTAVK